MADIWAASSVLQWKKLTSFRRPPGRPPPLLRLLFWLLLPKRRLFGGPLLLNGGFLSLICCWPLPAAALFLLFCCAFALAATFGPPAFAFCARCGNGVALSSFLTSILGNENWISFQPISQISRFILMVTRLLFLKYFGEWKDWELARHFDLISFSDFLSLLCTQFISTY